MEKEVLERILDITPFYLKELSTKFGICILGFYLQGKPDTEEWRRIHLENNEIPIVKNGRMYGHKFLLDYHKLHSKDPTIDSAIPPGYNIDTAKLPSLEETITQCIEFSKTPAGKDFRYLTIKWNVSS